MSPSRATKGSVEQVEELVRTGRDEIRHTSHTLLLDSGS